MKRTLLLLLTVGICWATNPFCARAADVEAEAKLIATLQSTTASPKQKSEACAELKRAGTANCIPAVAALLTDTNLSHSARYVLESLPDAGAGKALLDALPKTSGFLSVGIINSLAVRGEMAAIPFLGKLLRSTNQNVAIASAEALGHLGGSKSLSYLQSAAAKSTNALHDAELDGILMCANRLLDSGKADDALPVFKKIYATEKADRLRIAAFRGMVLSSGKDASTMVADAISKGDPATQSAALLVAGRLEGTNTTFVLMGLVPKANVPVQLALLQCFDQRNDALALPAVVPLAGSSDADVRIAALTALGTLGDDSTVELLAEAAGKGRGMERNTARQALLDIRHGAVTSRMLALLDTANAATKAELLRALGGRGDQAAVPVIIELAQKGTDSERNNAMQTLSDLADASQIPLLVKMATNSQTEGAPAAMADVLNSVYQRSQNPKTKPDVTALVNAIKSGTPEVKMALLPVCSGIARSEVREVLRATANDNDALIRDSAIHAICETRDPELLPDLVKLACYQTESNFPQLAIRGCVRLMTQEEGVKFSNSEKVDTFRKILATPINISDKRLLLSALGTVADDKSLALTVGLLDDSTVKTEAEQAVVKIAAATSTEHPAEASAALKKVLASTTEPATQKSAKAALDKIK